MVLSPLVVRKLHDGACNFAGKLHDRACNFDFLKEMRRKMGEGAGRWRRLGEGSEPLSSSVALLIKQGWPGHILPSRKKSFGKKWAMKNTTLCLTMLTTMMYNALMIIDSTSFQFPRWLEWYPPPSLDRIFPNHTRKCLLVVSLIPKHIELECGLSLYI